MKVFKRVEDSLIVECAILEVYLPLALKDILIIEQGDVCNIYGSYYLQPFMTEKDWENRKNDAPLANTILASFFATTPSERDIAELKVNGRSLTEFAVLRYFKGDRFVNNVNLIKSLMNDEVTMKLFLSGKLDYLDYQDMIRSIQKCSVVNGINHRVGSYMYGLMASTIYLDPVDDKPARFMKNPRIVVGYTPREITAKSSTSSAITFEEPNTMVIVADNKVRKGVKEPDSQLEKALKGDISGLE